MSRGVKIYTEKEPQLVLEFLLFLIVRINILISKKGSDSADFYCNVVKFEISRIALNQGFYRLLTCSESLFHLCKHNVFAKFW